MNENGVRETFDFRFFFLRLICPKEKQVQYGWRIGFQKKNGSTLIALIDCMPWWTCLEFIFVFQIFILQFKFLIPVIRRSEDLWI